MGVIPVTDTTLSSQNSTLGLSAGFSKRASIAVEGETLSSYIQKISGLIAYYPMDEASGSMLNTAPATLGSLNGTPSGVTYAQPGLIGDAYSFDGSDDFVSIADSDLIEGFSEITWFIFFKPPVDKNSFIKLLFKDGVIDLGINNSNDIFGEIGNVQNLGTLGNSPTLNDGEWHMVGITYNGEVANAFIDGVLVESIVVGGAPLVGTGTGALALGRHEANQNEYFEGLMQHFGIVSRALNGNVFSRMIELAGL